MTASYPGSGFITLPKDGSILLKKKLFNVRHAHTRYQHMYNKEQNSDYFDMKGRKE